jgi:hypothetical protein
MTAGDQVRLNFMNKDTSYGRNIQIIQIRNFQQLEFRFKVTITQFLNWKEFRTLLTSAGSLLVDCNGFLN